MCVHNCKGSTCVVNRKPNSGHPAVTNAVKKKATLGENVIIPFVSLKDSVAETDAGLVERLELFSG